MLDVHPFVFSKGISFWHLQSRKFKKGGNQIMQTIEEKLKEKLAVLNHYERAITLLNWDMYTAVPRLGYQGMADTVAFLSQ